MALGRETEKGLIELYKANAEDYLTLFLLSEKLEQLGKKEEAKLLREKAYIELGHAKAIFEILLKYKDISEIVSRAEAEEKEQHIAEYNKVAMKAKEEGYPQIEQMLCAFAEQEAKIAETLSKIKSILREFAEKESEEHIAEYNKVAMKAKEEGYPQIEQMLCAFAEQEAKIAETTKNIAKAF
jgi:rubrerythrin